MAEHTGPSENPPERRDQEASNPYRSPGAQTPLARHDILRQPTTNSAFVIVAIVFLPLVLSQVTFWSSFGLYMAMVRGSYEIFLQAGFVGLAVCAVSGFLYGILLARHIQRRSFRFDPATGQWQPAPTRYGQILLLASLNGFAFPALATGGCLGFAVIMSLAG